MFWGNTSAAAFDGLRVLLHSLRRHDRRRPFVLLTVEPVVGPAMDALQRVHPMRMVRVPTFHSLDKSCLASMPDGVRLSRTFTSFHSFNLTEYARVLWLESDQLVLRDLTELWSALDRPRPTDRTVLKKPRAAAAKTLVGPYTSCGSGRKSSKFNTGVMLLKPSTKVFDFFQSALSGGRLGYTCTDGSQTLWNQVMHGRVQCVHRTFNCIAREDLLGPSPGRHCLQGNTSMPHLAHFAGEVAKPWTKHTAKESLRRNRSWAYALWQQTLRSYLESEART